MTTLVDAPATLELTIVRWPSDGSTPVVEAGPWHREVYPGSSYTSFHLDHASAPYRFFRVGLQNWQPAGPGWVAGLIRLESESGQPFGAPRPVQVFTGPSDFPTVVQFPATAWHDAYSVLLRLPRGIEPEVPRPGDASDYAVIGEE